MSKILILSGILVLGNFVQSDSTKNQGGIFQALKQTEGGFNIGNWDGSRILSQKGDVLSTVTIKNGKLDFSRAPGQTRTDLLKSLYKAGLRKVFIAMEQFVVVSPQGEIGPAPSQNGLFQALKETDEGFDLNASAAQTDGSKTQVIFAKRTHKLSSPFGDYTAKDSQTDVILLLKIKGISSEEFEKIKEDKRYVLAGERRCELIYTLHFETGERELAFAVPKDVIELKLILGDIPAKSFKTETAITAELKSPAK